MAIDPNIALQAKGPDMLGQAGQVLGIARGAVDLASARSNLQQTQLATNQKIAAELQSHFTAVLDSDAAKKLADPNTPADQLPGLAAKVRQDLDFHRGYAQKALQNTSIDPNMANVQLQPFYDILQSDPRSFQRVGRQAQLQSMGQGAQVAQTQIPAAAQQTYAGTDVSGKPVVISKEPFGKISMETMGEEGGGKAPQMAPALGQPQAVAGTQDVVLKDWKETQDQAGVASRNIGVLQKLRLLSKKAITGVGAERRQYITGLAGLLGMDTAELEKTNTDELVKNANMLALVGGNTDAARALAEGANPNTTMTPEAIQHAADQIIAQQSLALKKQKFFLKYATNMEYDKGKGYTKAMQQWNEIADPRILQLKTMTIDEKRALINSMPEAERQEFLKKVDKFEKAGLMKD